MGREELVYLTTAADHPHSCSRSDRHLLPQVHSRWRCQERQARQIRGALHEAVRGPLP
jgi:hypothetical protein